MFYFVIYTLKEINLIILISIKKANSTSKKSFLQHDFLSQQLTTELGLEIWLKFKQNWLLILRTSIVFGPLNVWRDWKSHA